MGVLERKRKSHLVTVSLKEAPNHHVIVKKIFNEAEAKLVSGAHVTLLELKVWASQRKAQLLG